MYWTLLPGPKWLNGLGWAFIDGADAGNDELDIPGGGARVSLALGNPLLRMRAMSSAVGPKESRGCEADP